MLIVSDVEILNALLFDFERFRIFSKDFVAVFKDPVIHKFYERKISEGKNHLNVMRHVCYKLIFIIFEVLRDKKPYEPDQVSP